MMMAEVSDAVGDLHKPHCIQYVGHSTTIYFCDSRLRLDSYACCFSFLGLSLGI
jgi:hypothetical protein